VKVYNSLLKFHFYNPRPLNIIFVAVFLISFACSVQAAYSAQVTLAWNANTDPNIAGYKIYYGTSSRNYDVSVDLGNFTSCTISDMEEGKTYYFAATAYDIQGNESSFSEEVVFPNPQTDSDGDGIPDDDEIDIYGTDPQKADTDSDGIPDGWEIHNSLDALVKDGFKDADGDGFNNLTEYQRGTDPNDSNSHPSRSMPWIPLLLLGD